MKAIKSRPRLDKIDFDARAEGFSFGRTVYLILLFSLAVFLLNAFFGKMVLFRAQGLVMQEEHVVDALYNAQMAQIHVREGDRVQKGDALASVVSPVMLKEIAALSVQNADLRHKLSSAENRRNTIAALRPLAEQRAKNLRADAENLQALKGEGLVNNVRDRENTAELFQAETALAQLTAEDQVLSENIIWLKQQARQSKRNLMALKSAYSDGLIKAHASGIVGPKVASEGDVKLAGERILSIYSGSPFILSYLPEAYSFDLKPGMTVQLASGGRKTYGTISNLLPVADALPPEFQNLFRPRERTRLARIELGDDVPFTLLETVRIAGCDLFTCGDNSEGWAMQTALLDGWHKAQDVGHTMMAELKRSLDIQLDDVSKTGFASQSK